MPDFEFLRNTFHLPRKDASWPETFYVRAPGEQKPRVFCSCSPGKGDTGCVHSRELVANAREFLAATTSASPEKRLVSSVIHRLLEPCIRLRIPVNAVRVAHDPLGVVTVDSANGSVLFILTGDKKSAWRLLSRLGNLPDPSWSAFAMMRRARRFSLTEVERTLEESGVRSTRMAEEESVWFLAAYHCFLESGGKDPQISSWMDGETGNLHIAADWPGLNLAAIVPRGVVSAVLRLAQEGQATRRFEFDSGEHEIKFTVVDESDCGMVRLQAGISVATGPGEAGFVVAKSRFIHGDLLYSPAHETLFRFTHSSMGALAQRLHERPPMSRADLGMLLQKQASLFSLPTSPGSGQLSLFATSEECRLDRITDPPLVTRFDSMEIDPVDIGETECRIRVGYLFEGRRIGLDELLRAREAGVRYLVSATAIIDMTSDCVDALPLAGTDLHEDGTVTLPRSALLQFSGEHQVSAVSHAKRGRFAREFSHLMDITPLEPLRPLAGFTSVLRAYQHIGVEWLLFLHDNHFGGILCDEMGLGKTHQALGFITAIREQRGAKNPVLVVCPATVTGHWQGVIRHFAPGARVIPYLGSDRTTMGESLDSAIVITTYGILKKDADKLAGRLYSAVIFDEAQCIKNRSTGAWEAARSIKARVRLAITGTPIENSLADLKSLFDIVLPGYLGTDMDFADRFLGPIEGANDERAKHRFKRLASPFILRRLKKDVCAELPEKIIDIRDCGLSSQQGILYDTIMKGDAAAMSAKIRENKKPVAFMHVFRILDRLKQICDHPALFLKCPGTYLECQSEKFDLFAELLQEALDSGEKVVVFSQYLGMIDILCRHLQQTGTGYVSLTGASMNRADIVRRFNTDTSVRVFVGSLKAGGLGVDLTAASVVIHYDRWWNAVREDQATDRVHRIGQVNGVQVVKFIVRNSVEERIHGIIERKALLAQENLLADVPDKNKMFTREELLDLLTV